MATLYSYFRSSCSYRVRIVLHYLGLSFDYKAVHLLNNGGEQLSESYQKINPMGQVPYFQDDHGGLSQSMAILEYLNDLHPEAKLLPIEAYSRAKVREFCEVVNAGIQPVQNLKVLIKIKKDLAASDEQKMEWGKNFIEDGLKSLERLVSHSKGNFCFDKFSLADAMLIPQIYNANRFGIDMTQYPILSQINEHCLGLEYFKAAHPDQQPDSPQI